MWIAAKVGIKGFLANSVQLPWAGTLYALLMPAVLDGDDALQELPTITETDLFIPSLMG